MATKIKAARTPVTGRVKATTTAADYGEISINIADRKLFIRDAAGVPQLIAQGIADYSDALIYALGDLTIESNKLYLCTTAVPVPEPFDLANWTVLSGGGGDLTAAVILAPATAGRNRIVPAAAAAEGLLIDAPSTQTADLLAIPGTALSDTGVWAVDSLGFSNQRVGAVVWRQAEPTHAFVARGQPAAFDGARWVPAEADVATGVALAVVQEIIDANTLVLRSGGRITNLQTAAFAGGVITPATTYYVSAAVAGQLTPVEPTTGRRDPVLRTISATAGVVITGGSRNLVEAPPPTTVGPTAPSAPELGDLWYRTTVPIGLYVWRDDVSIGEWVPATPDAVVIGDVAPTSPEAGQLWFRTIDPVGLFIWYTDVDSSQWVSVGGGGGGGGGDTTPTEIVGSGLPSANWQVVGDMLIQWGITRINAIPQNLTLPKAFKTLPVATGSTDNSTDVNVTVWPDRVDRLVLRMFVQTGAAAPLGLDVYWVAIGEALDVDKMPKTVGTASGADFATTAEARAGVVADKVMSPALVQARSGEQSIGPTGLFTFVFDQIPNEANEIDLIFNGVGQPANGVIRFDWQGAPNARAFSSRVGVVSGVTPTVVGDDNNTQFVLDQTNTAWGVAGLIMLRRAGGRGGAWAVNGSLRRATNIMLLPAGSFNMNSDTNAFLRFNSNLAFTSGLLTARWRI